MKKLLIMFVALLMLVPLVGHAETKTEEKCDPKKNTCVVIPSEGEDDTIRTEEDETEGYVKKIFPIYVEQPKAKEITSVTVTITYESAAITGHGFSAASPYQVSKDGKTATFSVPAGTEGLKDTKIVVGYVEIMVNTKEDDCSFGYSSSLKVVKTGAFVNYLTFVGGAIIIAGIYTTTKSKKKMYNI